MPAAPPSAASPTTTDSSCSLGTDQLAGGRYTVAAEIPPSLSELAPVPASETYAPFVTTVDVSTSSQTVRMGVAPRPAPTEAATAPTVGPPPTVASRPPRFAVGDYVWRDLNRSGVQDPSEPPAAEVSVQLVGLDGEIVESTVSAASGRYLVRRPAGRLVHRSLRRGSQRLPADRGRERRRPRGRLRPRLCRRDATVHSGRRGAERARRLRGRRGPRRLHQCDHRCRHHLVALRAG